jgi:hypothetical protein
MARNMAAVVLRPVVSCCAACASTVASDFGVRGGPADLGLGGAWGLDELRRAVDCLDAYEPWQPEHFDRHDINAQLQSRVWHGEETP